MTQIVTVGPAPVKASMVSRLGGGLMLLIVGLGFGTAIAVAPDIAGAAMVLQLPGVIAWLIDPTPGRAVGRTIVLFQGAASVHPIAAIWFQCEGLRACVAMATDTRTVSVVLFAAMAGFALTQGLPIILRLLEETKTRARHARLVEQRAELVGEWELDR